MDAEQALELVKHGSTLLLLDVPQHTLIGIDTQIFFAGPVFMGIKMIPPGVHFIYYSSSSREGKDFSPIIGFFVETSPSEVVIRRWNPLEERLVKVSEEEEERYSRAVKNMEFDRQLGAYTLMEYRNWRQLSSFLTKDIIEKIEPIGGEITVACESRLVDDFPKSAMERALHEQSMTSKFRRADGKSEQKGCYFTPIPRIVKHTGISGQELTTLNLDKTHLLERLLAAEYGGNEDRLLGELQFVFVAFLMGQSLESFLQWKSLVSLLHGCSEGPFRTRTEFFTKAELSTTKRSLQDAFNQSQVDTTDNSNFPNIGIDGPYGDGWERENWPVPVEQNLMDKLDNVDLGPFGVRYSVDGNVDVDHLGRLMTVRVDVETFVWET